MIHRAGDTANLDELRDDLEKTPASERAGQGYSSRQNRAIFKRQRPSKLLPRQMKDEPAIANFGIESS